MRAPFNFSTISFKATLPICEYSSPLSIAFFMRGGENDEYKRTKELLFQDTFEDIMEK